MKERIEKCVLMFIMVVWWALLPQVGYENGDVTDLPSHFLYMFSHANVWHLAGNLLWLWFFVRGRLYLLPSLAIGFLCSFIPAWSPWGMGVTMGFSGVLFAIAGIKWGIYCRNASAMGSIFERSALDEFAAKALPFALIGIIIPHINWCIHLYCLIAGFAYGRCWR